MRWRWIVLAALAEASSLAQTLDLRPAPTPPAPGEGAAALALADRLESEAADLEKSGGASEAARARASWRRAARAIVLAGEEMGEPGSSHVLVALTLASRAREIDSLIGDPASASSLGAIRSDLDAIAGAPHREVAELDRALRGALAPLAPGTPRPDAGWTHERASDRRPLADDLDRWRSLPGVTPGAIEAARALDESLSALHATRGSACFARGIEALRGRVRGAGVGVESLPGWVTGSAREECGAAFDRGLREVGDPATRDAGLRRLAWLAGVARLAGLVDRLPSTGDARRVRDGLLEQMSALSRGGGLDLRPLDNLELALDLALRRASIGDDRNLLRQARPAWWEIHTETARSEQRLLAALPRLIAEADAMTDPGIVSLLSEHRRNLDDLAGLRRAGDILAPRQAAIAPTLPGLPSGPARENEHVLAANRLLELGQTLAKKDASAREAIRELTDGLSRWHEFDDERALRDAPAIGAGRPGENAWAKVLAGRDRDLLAGIERARRGWILAWAKGEPTRDPAASLEALEIILSLARDAVELRSIDPRAGGHALAWPGWELSGRTGQLVRSRLEADVASLVNHALDRGPETSLRACREARAAHALASLWAELERRARALASEPGVDASATRCLVEAAPGSPMPGEAWLADRRATLASICRYAEEWSLAVERNESSRASTLGEFVAARARGLLLDLDR